MYLNMSPCNLPFDYFLCNLDSHIDSKSIGRFPKLYMIFLTKTKKYNKIIRIDCENALQLVSLKFIFEFLNILNLVNHLKNGFKLLTTIKLHALYRMVKYL